MIARRNVLSLLSSEIATRCFSRVQRPLADTAIADVQPSSLVSLLVDNFAVMTSVPALTARCFDLLAAAEDEEL